MKKLHISLQVKFLLSIILIVVPVLGIIFTWTGIQNEKQAKEQVLTQARVLSRQVILTRQWITDCGGVMVPLESKGAKNTACFIDDKLQTSRGLYQRFTPAMVTRKLSQYSLKQDLYGFRLASLTPLNPSNTPDSFEKKALNSFKNINSLFLNSKKSKKSYAKEKNHDYNTETKDMNILTKIKLKITGRKIALLVISIILLREKAITLLQIFIDLDFISKYRINSLKTNFRGCNSRLRILKILF